jgi:hypothetical protein
MSLPPESTRWSLLIYRVSGPEHQQRILRAFHRISWPGVTVLGTGIADESFVIVDCDSPSLEAHARHVVQRFDAGATRVLRSGRRAIQAAG